MTGFNGSILFGFNWDVFWEIVVAGYNPLNETLKLTDFVRVSAYFPMNDSYGEMVEGWNRVAELVERGYRPFGKPAIFTEFGVGSVDGAVSRPYDYSYIASPDYEEQRDYYRAFFKVFGRLLGRVLKGYVVWCVVPGLKFSRWDYSFVGKPVEEVLRVSQNGSLPSKTLCML